MFMTALAGYECPFWITYKQARKRGGHVRKGEKGTPIVFWKWLDKVETDPATGERRERKIPLLRYYTVFNAKQCDGIETPEMPRRPVDFSPIESAERIVSEMPKQPEIRHGMSGAFYRPADDLVGMPDRGRFNSPEEYYCTLFHELTHATGHESRVGRDGIADIKPFGSPTYSREELVAETGAAFLCGESGISPATMDNSTAYLAGWIRKLRGDSRLVVVAAAAAQKAADYILSTKF